MIDDLGQLGHVNTDLLAAGPVGARPLVFGSNGQFALMEITSASPGDFLEYCSGGLRWAPSGDACGTGHRTVGGADENVSGPGAGGSVSARNGQVELAAIQDLSVRLRGEVEQQSRTIEKQKGENEWLKAQMETLRAEVAEIKALLKK